MNMTLQQIAKACGGALSNAEGKESEKIQGAVLDSRLVEPGYLFLATRGERVDGHSFIPDVAKKGAACVVCEEAPAEVNVPYILVEDSFQALKDIAQAYRQTLHIPVIGITGSVGKTSTKEFIAAVLSEKYRVLKTEGNFNNEVGLPLTILRIREEHEAAVLEMGISEFGEMHRLSKIARPDICVITNIGQCHLENLGSREGILKAKSEIFDYMNRQGHIVLNGDDDMLAGIREVHGIRPVRFGINCGSICDVYASEVESKGLFGSEAVMHLEGKEYPVKVTLPGLHMVGNALAAACVARLLNLDPSEICKGIEKVRPVGGRSNIVQTGKFVVIDDCYNANPVSVKAALDLLQSAEGRKVAILGDMFELGTDEKKLHGDVGRYAVEKEMDVLLCVGSLSKYMYEEAMRDWDGVIDVRYFEGKEELLEMLPDILAEGDTVLVKASHGMHFEELVEWFAEN